MTGPPGPPGLPVLRRLLADSLVALAADAVSQAAWVRLHGASVDEFALDFEHAPRTAGPRLVEAVEGSALTAGLLCRPTHR